MSDPLTGFREGEQALLRRARAGDEAAFGELTEPFRRELQVHCYRIVGSVQDAEDLVQEALLAAWRGLDGFEGRSSMRTWLYRIATNRCLNVLRARGCRLPEPPPEEPPRQRAVLVLRDVLGFRAAETAAMLRISEASANGALRSLPASPTRACSAPSASHERCQDSRDGLRRTARCARPHSPRQPDRCSERKMFGGLTFMVGGHMCCGVNGNELIVRLDPEREHEALARPYARTMDFTGRPMAGFITVRPEGLKGGRLTSWVREAIARAESLPPK